MRLLRTYVLLIGVSLISLFPLLWALSTSLKDRGEVETYPPRWLPSLPTLANFYNVIVETATAQLFLNSTVVGMGSVLLCLLVATHAAYALARFRFPGKAPLAFAVLMTSMVPEICTLVPLFYLASAIGLYDTYLVLIVVYAAMQVPTIMWFLRGFFDTVPREIDEAAQIDGCTRWMVFYRVILPLSKPGMAAAALLVFIFVWNDFLFAFTLTISEGKRLLGVGLYQYISQYGVDWANLMALVVLALGPVVMLFLLLQRQFISGLTSGATKG